MMLLDIYTQPELCCRQAAVYHRDLKLENALIHISGAGGAAPYLKICDFGFSKVCVRHMVSFLTLQAVAWRKRECHRGFCCLFIQPLQSTKETRHQHAPLETDILAWRSLQHAIADSAPKSAKGTVEYLAPEVVLCSYKKNYDGKMSDVWSCGVILCASQHF